MVPNEPTKKIAMVVDDDPVARKVLKSIFEALDYDVVFANNGREAFGFFRENISVITMDQNMPEMSGIDATKAIRKRETIFKSESPVWILGITVDKDSATVEACLAAGMNHVITKPINEDQIKACLMGVV